MKGYLVLARCLSDDVPLALFDDLEAARAFATAATLETVQAVAGQAFKMDVSDCLNVTVVEMDGAKLPHVIVHIDK